MSGKKKTKLKKIELTSVDMVRRGANQDAHINLYKSAGDPEAPPDEPEAPKSDENSKGLWKAIVDAANTFLGKSEAQNPPPDDLGEPPEDSGHENVEKTAETFMTRVSQQELRDKRWKYQDALNMSIESILMDNDLSLEEKVNMINESVDEFATAYKEMCSQLAKTTKPSEEKEKTEPTAVGKTQEETPDNLEKGEEDMKIDKSRFSPEELAQYNALIAKGLVEDDDDFEEGAEGAEVEKSAEMHPEIQKALNEMAELKKGIEMKEMTEIAKKYSILGKKEDELATTLYDMKKSSPSAYDAYIAVLDQNLELVNKSGMYEEIGKSSRGMGGGNAVAQAEGIAKSYMEKDPTMDYNTALLKAWENNPELMDACDAEY